MIIRVLTSSLGNPRVTLSRMGYHAAANGSFEKRLGSGTFPRIHVYLKSLGPETELSLHIDVKPHTYTGFRAHVGEYDSDELALEAKRIQQHLSSVKTV